MTRSRAVDKGELLSLGLTLIGLGVGGLFFLANTRQLTQEMLRARYAFLAILHTLEARGWITLERDPKRQRRIEDGPWTGGYSIPNVDGRPGLGVFIADARPARLRHRINWRFLLGMIAFGLLLLAGVLLALLSVGSS